MVIEKKIIIPDVEFMSDEEYATMIDLLESLPINYQIWESTN